MESSNTTSPELKLSRAGERAVYAAPAQHFSGAVQVEMLYQPVDAERASAGNVTFQPGARTAWHSHPLGQTLVVTAGSGRVQRWGGPLEPIRVGDVVHIPAGVKHWHGAAPASAMTHIAITEALDGVSAEWMEAVADTDHEFEPVDDLAPPSSAVGTVARVAFEEPRR